MHPDHRPTLGTKQIINVTELAESAPGTNGIAPSVECPADANIANVILANLGPLALLRPGHYQMAVIANGRYQIFQVEVPTLDLRIRMGRYDDPFVSAYDIAL